jgi:methanethiol S-methyltransferase
MDVYNYLILIVGWVLYYAFHSIFATEDVKSVLVPVMGKATRYRLVYSIISLAGLVLIVLFIRQIPNHFVYEPSGWSRYIGMVMAAWGTIILTLSFKSFSTAAFLGFKPEENNGLITHGLYSQMRHPLYTGTILVFAGLFCFIPLYAYLISSLITFSYIPIGIRLEERKLIAQFGEEYRAYKKQVKALTPWF